MLNLWIFLTLINAVITDDIRFTENFHKRRKIAELNDLEDEYHNDNICEIEPRPNCGTGECVPSKSNKKYFCQCPEGHSQENLTSPCKGVYLGVFGGDHPCRDGISTDDITAINSRTLHIENFHCNDATINCLQELQSSYFIAHMGTRDIRLNTVHFDECTGTALPGFFPASIYLEFPEDWYVESMYKLSLHDITYENTLCHIETTREQRDHLSKLEHPEETKCHHHVARVSIGRFGEKEKCRGHIHTENVYAINSRILKVNRFHCDGNEEQCHHLLEAAFFVGKRGKHSAFLKPIVHGYCPGFHLPQFQYSFTIFLEVPEHWSTDTLSSLLLWDFNTKKILCRIKLDDSTRRLVSLLPKAEKSKCRWEHSELQEEL